MKKKSTVRHFAEELYNFIESLNVYPKLEEMSAAEEKSGNLAGSKEHLKIWDDVVILFEQIVEALGEEKISAREFDAIVNEGLDALEMSLIPPGLDEVTISQFDQNSLQNMRAIYILGFGEGDFPRKTSEKGLLSDSDRLKMNETNLSGKGKLEISLGGRETAFAEKFLVYRGLTQAREYLRISYPLADEKGDGVYRSPILESIRKMFEKLSGKNGYRASYG